MIRNRLKTDDRVKVSALAITIALAILPFALRRLRGRGERKKQPARPTEKVFDKVDEASMESFPASDPPAY